MQMNQLQSQIYLQAASLHPVIIQRFMFEIKNHKGLNQELYKLSLEFGNRLNAA